jgi:hypothetical protein
MILSHFSYEPLKFDSSRTYETLKISFKPNGFWLSDETQYGWKEWCENACYGSTEYKTDFQVDLKNILVLDTDEKILEFSKTHLIKNEERSVFVFDDDFIDWEKVINKYDGILISPYSKILGYKLCWYNSWDCASICVWNLMCLTQIF